MKVTCSHLQKIGYPLDNCCFSCHEHEEEKRHNSTKFNLCSNAAQYLLNKIDGESWLSIAEEREFFLKRLDKIHRLLKINSFDYLLEE